MHLLVSSFEKYRCNTKATVLRILLKQNELTAYVVILSVVRRSPIYNSH